MDKSKNPINTTSFYESLAKITPEAVVIHDQGKIMYANPSALKLTGLKNAKDIIGRNVMEFLDDDYKQKAMNRIETMLNTKKEVDWMEDIFVRSDGTRIIGQVRSIPFVFEGKSVILTIVRDVTTNKMSLRRQKILDELNKTFASSLKQNLTMESVIDVLVPSIADYCRIAIVDADKKIRTITKNDSHVKKGLPGKLLEAYLNDSSTEYGVASLIRNGKPEIIPVINDKVLKSYKTRGQVSEIVSKIGLKSYMGVPIKLRGKIIGAITFSSVREDRTYTNEDMKFAQEVAARISLELDNIRLYQEAQDEIKERKEIESMLIYLSEVSKILSSSLDYKTTLQTLAQLAVPAIADWCTVEILGPDGNLDLLAVAHVDPDKVKWARSYRKSFPTKPDPATSGMALSTKKPFYILEVTEEMIRQAVKKEEDIEILKKIGGISSLIIAPLIVKKKAIGLITFISSDPKKLYTQSDIAMAEEVASRAALAIENARLYTDAQKAIKIRDDFISIASHELRTPLTSLKMFTQILERRMDKANDKSTVEHIQKMDNQIDKLTSLIKTLLDVSRVRTGKLIYKMEYFDLNEVVADVVETIGKINYGHEIKIEGFVDKKVWGDKDKISQVIINLLTNAIKYSPNNKDVIVRLSSEKEVAVVSVQDFGIGIDKEHQNKIFNRFYRGAESSSKTFPGLGIGLYISYEIVKRHGGNMNVVSTGGKGSIFNFTLPYKAVKIEKNEE